MLSIYNEVRAVPKDALKEIQAGRLKGKSDINPMWRIKKLTEMFGPCGIGWWYVIKRSWLEHGVNDEVTAHVEIELYYRWGGSVSQPIPGTGGSAFVAREKAGMYVSDECYKMALTDAISVACKALGVGADVYWSADSTKYDRTPQTTPSTEKPTTPPPAPQKQENATQSQQKPSEAQLKRLFAIMNSSGVSQEEVKAYMDEKHGVKSSKELNKAQYDDVVKWMESQETPFK